MQLDDARLLDCLDLLLGAAWADGEYSADEQGVLDKIICGLTGSEQTTAEMRRCLAAFDRKRFEPAITCARLGLTAGDDALATYRRRAFISLLGRVVDADDVLAPAEERYITELAAIIGATPADYDSTLTDLGEIAGLLASPRDTRAHAGRVLGKRFEITRARQGGIDGRYVAYDRPLGARRVELRRLDRHVPDADAPRLLREAVAVGATGSPHLAAVYDVGGLADGTPFLVSEPLRGETLRRRLDRRTRLDPDDALRIADQMLAGLEAAHAAGITHRALTVDDVFLVTTVGVEDHVKLTGFGTTRLYHVERGAGRPIIGAGCTVSPERLGGAEIDERADLYSAAALIFEMLAGKPPYGDARRDSLLAFRPVRGVEPPLLSAVHRDLAPLDEVLGANLVADPDERMADAGEFRAALEEAAMLL